MKKAYEKILIEFLGIEMKEGILVASGKELTRIDPVRVEVTPMEEKSVDIDFGEINF